MSDIPPVTTTTSQVGDVSQVVKTEGYIPSVVMPDHPIRNALWYQLYVRLARPTLDWITNGAVLYTMILQPWLAHKFDAVAAGLSLGWAATVYGIKSWEKKAGVA